VCTCHLLADCLQLCITVLLYYSEVVYAVQIYDIVAGHCGKSYTVSKHVGVATVARDENC